MTPAPLDAQALLNQLGQLISSLNTQRNNIGDPDQQDQLQAQLTSLQASQKTLLTKQFDSKTAGYESVITALAKASDSADMVLDSVQNIADAIQKATAVASALESLAKTLV